MPTSKVTSIPDLSALRYDEKHVRARKALVHRTDDVQVNVYVLEPGGRVPAHRHTNSWDISVVIDGEIEVRFAEEGIARVLRCKPNAMTLVPPGTGHEISNPSVANTATFLLVQSPSSSFDFVKTVLPGSP
jgi:quercetin dioxygenase-like cupin family protein